QIEHDFKGPVKFRLDSGGVGATINFLTGAFANGDASANLTTPDVVTFGLRSKLDDEWTALLGVEWTNWKDFHDLTIKFKNPAQPNDVTVFDWKDSWFGSVGAEYRPNDRWTFKFGTGYDQSPTLDRTRNPRVPDADRAWLAGGIGFKASDKV